MTDNEHRWEDEGGAIPTEDGTPQSREYTPREQEAYDRGVRRGYHQALEDIEEMLRRQHKMVAQIDLRGIS